ncbi:MAG: ImmA/IrrE family metallo-endopeptidase [Pseudomonadota bacterium]
MDKARIDLEVAMLHRTIWTRRRELSSDANPSPLTLIEPRLVATRLLGLEYEIRPSIGGDGSRANGAPAAGFLDRSRGIIAVSEQFSEEVRRFTVAHEIAHFLLHDWIGAKVVHRDLPPIAAGVVPRPRHEVEADYFAASMLMPQKLVTKALAARFGAARLNADDEITSFYLASEGSKGFFEPRRDRLSFASAIARAESFAGRRFASLAGCFGVSVRAMAIRLDELGMAQG